MLQRKTETRSGVCSECKMNQTRSAPSFYLGNLANFPGKAGALLGDDDHEVDWLVAESEMFCLLSLGLSTDTSSTRRHETLAIVKCRVARVTRVRAPSTELILCHEILQIGRRRPEQISNSTV